MQRDLVQVVENSDEHDANSTGPQELRSNLTE